MALYIGKQKYCPIIKESKQPSSGDEIVYTNLTNTAIKANDKLWINTTAITTEKASAQLASANVIQTSNPNVAVSPSKLYTLQDEAYVQSSLVKTITPTNVGIDKNGLLYSSNALYDIENNIFYNDSFTSYVGNGYVYYTPTTIYKIDITNPANILNTYRFTNYSIATGWCFEDDVIIGLNAYYAQSRIWMLKENASGVEFNSIKNLSLGAITAIGQFSEQKIGWGLKGNSYKNLNLGAYRYSRNGDDVNVEEIPATEFPEDMRPMFTEQPSYVFWNEQTLTLTASWASTTPNKVLIFKYINGEWINKTPVISEFASNLKYITCDSSVSKIIVSSDAYAPIIYDGNEKSGGYYGVPYLYSRKESLIGKAQSDVAINQTGKATTVLFDSKVTPEPDTPTIDPSKLKFGDRIDNKATVVGTFNSSDLGTVVYAVLDAQYRGANIYCSSGLYGTDTGLPNYSKKENALNAKESATYNTDYIINNYSDKSIEAFTFVRNADNLTFNDKQYNCQLPNAYELQQIFNMKTELDALDPTAGANSTKKLSNWGFGSKHPVVWTSTECDSDDVWILDSDNAWSVSAKGVAPNYGVCPIIEIPLKEV